jgi:hypothetical protein
VIFAPPPAAPNAGHINTFVNSNNNHHLEKQQLRESLTAEIVADVEYEVNDLLAWAPESLTERDRKAIRDEVMAQARLSNGGGSSRSFGSTPLTGHIRSSQQWQSAN